MLQSYTADSRGQFRNDWLKSAHTFSFGDFRDPERMGYRSLRVINEDVVAPAGGFAPHGHKDMEIITYVLEGALEHKDSLGNGSIIRPGEIQRMSAGTGIRHSEMNASRDAPVHFLQIWIEPNQYGHAPSYEQVPLSETAGRGGFTPIARPSGGEGAISLNQDASILLGKPVTGETVQISLAAGRYGFLHIAQGEVEIAGQMYGSGDAYAFEGVETPLSLTAQEPSELLLFDLS